MSYFEVLEVLPEDPIMSLPAAFAADEREKKANLGVGAYRGSEGSPYVLNAVKKAEEWLLQEHLNKEYQPIEGNHAFRKAAMELLYGINCPRLAAGEMFAAQTLGGTGGLRIGAEIMAEETRTVFVSDPTWGNHEVIFSQSGLNVEYYPYYDFQNKCIDFPALCGSIKGMPPGSVILLHGVCHNPTGCDLTEEQWRELSALIKEQKIMPFFDIAYQGFGEGVEQDAFAVRLFAKEGHEMLVASSFSKNFGLYGERVGTLSIITDSKAAAEKVGSHIKYIIRALYSNPPSHGARIVATVLGNETLHHEWVEEVGLMRQRIRDMRETLAAGLMSEMPGRDFSFITKQKGMFCLCGLNKKQAKALKKEYGVYIPGSGRINVAALTAKNIDYVIESTVKAFQL